MSVTTARRALAAAAIAVALGAAGCGDSAEEEARQQVCDARADIDQQVKTLQDLTTGTVTADAVRGSVSAMRDDLRAIGEAQGDLSEDRREQVQAANEQFASEIRDLGGTILRSTSVDEARAQVSGAIDDLAGAYRSTLATVDCD